MKATSIAKGRAGGNEVEGVVVWWYAQATCRCTAVTARSAVGLDAKAATAGKRRWIAKEGIASATKES